MLSLRTYTVFKGLIEDEASVYDLFDQIDLDKNGLLEFSEFATACTNLQTFMNHQNLIFAFKSIDHDGNGKASLSELKSFFKNSVQLSKFCESVLAKADVDNDHYVAL